ncbi:MAG TPA: exo 1,3/1,4-beta-D-glucan glucohydrolase [Paucimonas sp.]|nr:exo 1,3/1,4-beta-D-glucan glucohydrolase [Paucimonas sp.]
MKNNTRQCMRGDTGATRNGRRKRLLAIAAAGAALLAASGCGNQADMDAADAQGGARQLATATVSALPTYTDWPAIASAIPKDAAMEARIDGIIASMTLAQKVGQMTQPEIKSITPAQVTQYYIGSVLNGGGSWPNNNKYATAADWVALADRYYDASMATDMATKIPLIWGTDAVHGHNNVYGATIFPHNIGLGAARNPALITQIGAAVGKQVRATGIDWVFAPTLAVVRDDRWGRAYEGFSEDPAIVNQYGGAYVTGLQGTFASDANVVATAKHFIGDGGTDQGTDQGVNKASKADMINLHGQGYYSALAAGAQTVMASFNGWNDVAAGVDYGKMHGSKTMLTDILKAKMGFDGLVVSDWNGIAQVPGCSNASCPQAINAGIDMVMVPDDWQAFIANTIAQVQSGQIPMARIDDAVRRILRVKLRAGLFDGKKPSLNTNAGSQSALQARTLARQAVQQSLVLLKNNGGVLPLTRGKRILVVGKSADSLQNQTGGWSLTWQGTGNQNSDFPAGDTIIAGIREAAGSANVTYSATGSGVNVAGYDAVIAVLGETPYAEGVGDIGASGTLLHSSRHPEDLAALDAVYGKGVPVVTVFVAGRPLYVNDLLNRSNAFVAAWLPGTEGKGVADVIFRASSGRINKSFTGLLPFSWPKSGCQTALNVNDAGYAPLFAYGYGLRYGDATTVGTLDETAPTTGCGIGGDASAPLQIFNQVDKPPYTLYVSAAANGWAGTAVGSDLNATLDLPAGNPSIRVQTTQINVQQDAKLVTWYAPAQIYAQSAQKYNLQSYVNANAALQFDTVTTQLPQGAVAITMDCGYPCRGELNITNVMKRVGANVKQTVKIPLACFAAVGTDFANLDTPFLIYSGGGFAAAFTNIRIVPGAAGDADALGCPAVTGAAGG